MENACRDTLLCKEGENLIAGLPGRSEPDARTVSVISMLLGDDLVREYGNSAKAGRKLRNCRKYGWGHVFMRDDWKNIYGNGVTRKGTHQ